MTTNAVILSLVLCTLVEMISCTSPLDVNTPRIRTVTPPPVHTALPESLRVRPTGVQVEVTESDVSGKWVSAADTLVKFSLDTTFTAPVHWIGGMLYANATAMSRAPTIKAIYFHCDSIVAGSSNVLTGNSLKVLANRRIGAATRLDTLSADSVSAVLFSKYDRPNREIVDSLQIGIRNGLYGDAVVAYTAVMRVRY